MCRKKRMINLLPEEKKKNLEGEEAKRVIFALGIPLVVGLVCFCLVLLSIKFYLMSEIVGLESMVPKANPALENAKTLVVKYNSILSQAQAILKDKNYFYDGFEEILGQAPKEIQMGNFSMYKKSGIIIATISGSADTREDLLLFKKNIESDKWIKSSQFSTDSWVKEKNGSFNLTFQILNENSK